MAQNTIRSPGGVIQCLLDQSGCTVLCLAQLFLSLCFLISLTPSSVFLHTKWQDVRREAPSGTAPRVLPGEASVCISVSCFPLVLSHKMPRLHAAAFRPGNLQQCLEGVVGEGDAPPRPPPPLSGAGGVCVSICRQDNCATREAEPGDLLLFLLREPVHLIQELGAGAALTRGGCVMISFECQPAQSTGAQTRLYFRVCRGCLDGVKIGISFTAVWTVLRSSWSKR